MGIKNPVPIIQNGISTYLGILNGRWDGLKRDRGLGVFHRLVIQRK